MERTETMVGVLLDRAGFGKSFPLLALMLHEKRTFGKTQNLLVIPHNIHQQWLDYIEAFSDELTVQSLMYYGDVTGLFYDMSIIDDYDILITTETFFPMIAQTVRDIDTYFARVIIDEVDTISIFTDTEIPALAVWLVSATAKLTSDGSYAKYIKQGHTIQCTEDFISKSIHLPLPLVKNHRCFNEYINILQGVVVNKLPLYALDTSEYKFRYFNKHISSFKDLLLIFYNDFALELQTLQESLDNMSKRSIHPEVKKRLNYGVAESTVVMTNGRQTEKIKTTKIDGLLEKEQRYETVKSHMRKITDGCYKRICPLCAEYFAETSELEKVTIVCCNQVMYHTNCLTLYTNKSNGRCPGCVKKIVVGPSIDLIETPKTGYKDKIDTLNDIIMEEKSKGERSKNFRMLIFSDYVGSFVPIKQILERNGIAYGEMGGNLLDINEALEDFTTSVTPVLLVHSQYGAGSNLEMASSIVLLHKTPRQEQLEGRAQRLGRDTQLTIHHLLYTTE
jgi:SNF2 family DNA or RNA helicase